MPIEVEAGTIMMRLTLYFGCLATFLLTLSMALPAPKLLLSMASITGRTPGCESL